jgi:hypothetical protein
MSQVKSRETKTNKKTKLSVRGRLSVYLDPSTLNSCEEKTLHFIGVGWFKNASNLQEIEKTEQGETISKTLKAAACDNCGRIWRKNNSKNGGILKTCPECRIRKEILSKIRIIQ